MAEPDRLGDSAVLEDCVLHGRVGRRLCVETPKPSDLEAAHEAKPLQDVEMVRGVAVVAAARLDDGKEGDAGSTKNQIVDSGATALKHGVVLKAAPKRHQ